MSVKLALLDADDVIVDTTYIDDNFVFAVLKQAQPAPTNGIDLLGYIKNLMTTRTPNKSAAMLADLASLLFDALCEHTDLTTHICDCIRADRLHNQTQLINLIRTRLIARTEREALDTLLADDYTTGLD
jgi:hypothetical protein